MRLDVVSLAPEALTPLLELGVIGRAFKAGIAELHLHNTRGLGLANVVAGLEVGARAAPARAAAIVV